MLVQEKVTESEGLNVIVNNIDLILIAPDTRQVATHQTWSLLGQKNAVAPANNPSSAREGGSLFLPKVLLIFLQSIHTSHPNVFKLLIIQFD